MKEYDFEDNLEKKEYKPENKEVTAQRDVI
jgi:hypothetical protein